MITNMLISDKVGRSTGWLTRQKQIAMRSRVTLGQSGEEHQHGGDSGYFMIQNIRARMGSFSQLSEIGCWIAAKTIGIVSFWHMEEMLTHRSMVPLSSKPRNRVKCHHIRNSGKTVDMYCCQDRRAC